MDEEKDALEKTKGNQICGLLVCGRGEKASKLKQRSPRTTVNWDVFKSLVGPWVDTVVDNIDEEYDRLVEYLYVSAIKAESPKVTKRRLSPQTLELIRQRGITRAAGNRNLTSKVAKRCREANKEDFKERRAAVMAEDAEAGKSIRKAQ
ncbi:hypothetical protein KIN20_021587 [Parelaphostrongylus tenuis]|uniref:Uncharacterized protein n=1 Tax=Parelaphostrongylus tenuis TaxID=148309 RepID=A0AAD5QUM8_PARTN|nr:hypothetical protein KIN20_021587 [Parelaphostrongylus tenuis]